MSYLTFLRFTTDFRYNDSNNINAIMAPKYFQDYDPIFPTMGFKDNYDYISYYPSEFLRNSEYGKLMHADVDDAYTYPCIRNNDICVNLMDCRYEPCEETDLKEFLDSITDNILHGFVFLFPTVSEILECEGLENISKKKLTFCMDWDCYGS